MKKLASTTFALVLGSGLVACESRHSEAEPSPDRAVAQPAHPAQAATAKDEAAQASKIEVAGVGSCEPSANVSAAVARAVDLADADGDGKVTHEEARSAMNFVVGGAFFRADANGDGKITPEEGRNARAELTSRYPALGAVLTQAKQATGQSPFRSLARVLDIEYGKTLNIDDARKAVSDATDELFKAADHNHDGSITRDEAIQTGWDQAQALGHDAFAAADSDKDGFITQAEFQSVIDRSAKPVFNAADANKDGKLSEREAAVAMNNIADRLGIETPSEPTAAAAATSQSDKRVQ